MKNLKFVFLILFGIAGTIHGQDLLGVQFQNSGTGGANQAGFQQVILSGNVTSVSQTFTGLDTGLTSGTLTLQVSEQLNQGLQNILARNRTVIPSSGSFTNGNLYSAVMAMQSGSGALVFSLGGLNASTQYNLTFYAYDENSVGTFTETFTNTTTGSGNPTATLNWTGGNVGTTFNSSTSNTVFATTMTFTSDSLGKISFTEAQNTGNAATLNGFTIDAVAVPEPSVMVLLGAALAVLLLLPRIREARVHERA